MITKRIDCPHCVRGFQYRNVTNPMSNVHGWTPVENDHTGTWYVRECATCGGTAKMLKANSSVPVIPPAHMPRQIDKV